MNRVTFMESQVYTQDGVLVLKMEHKDGRDANSDDLIVVIDEETNNEVSEEEVDECNCLCTDKEAALLEM